MKASWWSFVWIPAVAMVVTGARAEAVSPCCAVASDGSSCNETLTIPFVFSGCTEVDDSSCIAGGPDGSCVCIAGVCTPECTDSAAKGCCSGGEGSNCPGAPILTCGRLEGEIEPVAVTFFDGTPELEIPGLLWLPPGGTTTVLLAIHGSSGVKEYWGSIGVHGYSFADQHVSRGRAVVAIDLPAYRPGETALGFGIETYAAIVDRVVASLRAASYDVPGGDAFPFANVVGVGWSMGALIVDGVQGLFGSFDAIIPAAWSHGGFSEEQIDCSVPRFECPDAKEQVFYLGDDGANVEANAVANMLGCPDYRGLPPLTLVSAIAWSVPTEGFRDFGVGAAPVGLDDVTMTITGPVLIILGEHDWFYDQSRLQNEPSHFPHADVELLLLEQTGHDVFHHKSKDLVHAKIGDWLASRGL